jgi:hypothetical protein
LSHQECGNPQSRSFPAFQLCAFASLRRIDFRDRAFLKSFGTAVAIGHQRWPRVKATRAVMNEEGVMAAKKIQAKSKSKTSAKKGARKVSPTTPRGMARKALTPPMQNLD